MSGSGLPRRLPGPVRAVLALFALALLAFTHGAAGSWADGSRLGTIQAIVEHGTLALDDTDYLWQGDKVLLGGRFYSHQPPMMAVLGAAPYAVLRGAFGLAIDSGVTYRVLTWLLVGLPVWLGMRALARLALAAGAGARWTALLVAGAAFGTLVLPWSLVLNQHGCAAGLALVALAAAADRRPVLAGALLSVAATVDLTAAFPALATLVPVARGSGWRGVARYAIAAVPALALHATLNLSIAGDLLPFALHREGFDYPGSPFLLMSLTGVDGGEDAGARLGYLLGCAFGWSGLFSSHPILVPAVLAGLALPFRRRLGAPPFPPGVLAAAGLSAAAIFLYYATQSRNYGGSAFGVRWLVVFAPQLFLFPARWIGTRREPVRLGALGATALGLAFAWSVATAALGAVQPWTKIAWRWELSPAGMVAGPGAERPSPREHLRREWERITDWRIRFDRQSYDRLYATLLDQQRRLYLERYAGVPEPRRGELRREGRDQLQGVVDRLDRVNSPLASRVTGHFYLGLYHKALGDLARACAEFRTCVGLDPRYTPAERQLEKLGCP